MLHILDEMKAVYEKIQRDVAHLIEPEDIDRRVTKGNPRVTPTLGNKKVDQESIVTNRKSNSHLCS